MGIKVVGRSHKLKKNYRTTRKILDWSLSVLGEGEFDDLDDGTDHHDYAGYYSLRAGSAPEFAGHETRFDQYQALIAQVRSWLDDGIEPDQIAIAARTSKLLDGIALALAKAELPTVILGQDEPKEIGLHLATMHRMKGLEYRCVAVVDVDADTVPLPWAVTDPAADRVRYVADLQRERCLLYVACTRAREHLWLGWSGKPSAFLSRDA